MSVSYWQDRSGSQLVTADVCIVGAGIAGLGAAYHLHRADPNLRIVIVERADVGAGASGRNAGFLLVGTADYYASDCARYGRDIARTLYTYSRENSRHVQEFMEREGVRFELERVGSLTCADSPEEWETLRESVGMMREDGFEVDLVDEVGVRAEFPAAGFLGGMYVPENAALHPMKLLEGLASVCGAEILRGWEVHRIASEPSVHRVATRLGTVEAATLVFCTNGYSQTVDAWLGAAVRPVRAQMLATEPVPTRLLRCPIYAHWGFDYLRQRADGTVLMGGRRHLHVEAEVGLEDMPSEGLQADLAAYLCAMFPSVWSASPPATHRWTGVMGFTRDHLPIVGAHPERPRTYVLGGFSGHGMSYAFRLSELLAEVIMHGASPGVLDPARLADV